MHSFFLIKSTPSVKKYKSVQITTLQREYVAKMPVYCNGRKINHTTLAQTTILGMKLYYCSSDKSKLYMIIKLH